MFSVGYGVQALGRSGLKVSVVGLGTWQFSEAWSVTQYEDAKAIVAKAVELGVNPFDTAALYGRGMSERFLGQAIRELGVRDQVVVATKIHDEFLAQHDVLKAVRATLRRLGFDVIDLMQVHWPPVWHNFPTCEYMRELERAVHLGMVRHIGVSNFPVELLESARSCLAREEIVSMQIRYNVVERDAEKQLIPYAEREGMAVLAWSPLAKGALTGKYTPENLPRFQDVRAQDPLFHPENFAQVYRVVEVLKKVGKRHGKTPAQVALNWLIMASPVVIPIPGAKNPIRRPITPALLGGGWVSMSGLRSSVLAAA